MFCIGCILAALSNWTIFEQFMSNDVNIRRLLFGDWLSTKCLMYQIMHKTFFHSLNSLRFSTRILKAAELCDLQAIQKQRLIKFSIQDPIPILTFPKALLPSLLHPYHNYPCCHFGIDLFQNAQDYHPSITTPFKQTTPIYNPEQYLPRLLSPILPHWQLSEGNWCWH